MDAAGLSAAGHLPEHRGALTVRGLRVPAAIIAGAVWTSAFIDGLLTQMWVALGLTTPVATGVLYAIFNIKNGNGQPRE